jgi:hypothetical protein
MAVPSVNATSLVGPNLGTGGAYALGPGDAQEPAWVGQGTFTGDGSVTTSNLNFIDGTNAIPFTPTGVRVSKIGGNDTAVNAIPLVNTTAALNNVAVAINWNVAIASGKTQIILVELYK